jgi:hypothetical protein
LGRSPLSFEGKERSQLATKAIYDFAGSNKKVKIKAEMI